MTLLDSDESIPPNISVFAAVVAVRMACEGIPVAAIARSISRASGEVHGTLAMAQVSGQISAVPKYDWPPTSKLADHLPCHAVEMPETDVVFNARRVFKLTPLEAGFIVVLLRCEHADKARLHTVIENQRFSRASNPDRLEVTDQKMVDVMICKLRKKLVTVDERFTIETVWGSGYYIAPAVRALINARLSEKPAEPAAE